MREVRCYRCGKLLGRYTKSDPGTSIEVSAAPSKEPSLIVKCPRCKAINNININ